MLTPTISAGPRFKLEEKCRTGVGIWVLDKNFEWKIRGVLYSAFFPLLFSFFLFFFSFFSPKIVKKWFSPRNYFLNFSVQTKQTFSKIRDIEKMTEFLLIPVILQIFLLLFNKPREDFNYLILQCSSPFMSLYFQKNRL